MYSRHPPLNSRRSKEKAYHFNFSLKVLTKGTRKTLNERIQTLRTQIDKHTCAIQLKNQHEYDKSVWVNPIFARGDMFVLDQPHFPKQWWLTPVRFPMGCTENYYLSFCTITWSFQRNTLEVDEKDINITISTNQASLASQVTPIEKMQHQNTEKILCQNCKPPIAHTELAAKFEEVSEQPQSRFMLILRGNKPSHHQCTTHVQVEKRELPTVRNDPATWFDEASGLQQTKQLQIQHSRYSMRKVCDQEYDNTDQDYTVDQIINHVCADDNICNNVCWCD